MVPHLDGNICRTICMHKTKTTQEKKSAHGTYFEVKIQKLKRLELLKLIQVTSRCCTGKKITNMTNNTVT